MDVPHLLWATVPPWAAVVFLAVDLVIRLLALGVVLHNRRPSAAWGWLLVIFFSDPGRAGVSGLGEGKFARSAPGQAAQGSGAGRRPRPRG